MPKQSKFSTTMTIELLFIMENIWNYGEKFSEREREKKKERAINIQSIVFKPSCTKYTPTNSNVYI